MNTLTSPRSDRPFLPSDLSPIGLIERAAFATFLAVRESAEEQDVCRRLWPNDRAAPLLVSRSAVNPGTTTATGWATETAQQAAAAFFGSLAPASAAAGLIERGLSVTMRRASTMAVPARSGSPVTLPWVAEGGVIPVRIESVAAPILDPRRMATIVAFSRELARRSSAEAVVTAMLREEASLALDSGYFSAAAGSSSTHAGLLYNITPLATAGNADDDLAQLAAAVGVGGSAGGIVFVAGPGRAAAISIRSPTLRVPVLASAAVPATQIIAVDASALVHAFGDSPEITASEEALLHMTDTASGSIMAGDPVRSLYQTAGIALRLIVDVGFVARRSGAVATVTGIYW
jgi:hypothetical protein